MRKALMIASEVRSGSTLIGEAIAYHFHKKFDDSLFDLTKEHFAYVNDNTSYDEILSTFHSLYLGRNGWVASKIMCASLSVLVREAKKADLLGNALFGPNTHWIIVRRRTKVRQAISLAFARKTDKWHVYSVEEQCTEVPLVTPGDIVNALRAILLADLYLEAFATLIGPERTTEVYYEDFLSDPTLLIDRLYGVLGVSRPPEGVSYVDETKIRPIESRLKRSAEREFMAWLVENHHEAIKGG